MKNPKAVFTKQVTDTDDDYVDFTTNGGASNIRTEHLYGNTQEQQVIYDNLENGKEHEEHYMSYNKETDKDQDGDNYMDLVTTNATKQQSNKTKNANDENLYGNVITEDGLYGNVANSKGF